MISQRITLEQIQECNPCASYQPEGKHYARLVVRVGAGRTVLEVLAAEDFPAADRLWLVLREKYLDERRLRLFACDCAERALARIANPDPRSLHAICVARRYANAAATVQELDAARDAALAAARAGRAALSAARAAALAAQAAAWRAAWEARAAACVAAWGAALDARDAARMEAAFAEGYWQLTRARYYYLNGRHLHKEDAS